MKRLFLKLLFTVVTIASLLVSIAPVQASTLIPPEPNPLPGGTLNPLSIPKYVSALVIPDVMPKTSSSNTLDYYEIAAKQFKQQVLPGNFPKTTVFGYGSMTDPNSFHYPADTIEAKVNKAVRVKWINGLVDSSGRFLKSILPIDQTLDWANPGAGVGGRDTRGTSQEPYAGPVPLVTHLHGAHVSEESDGYPQAWTLPAATNIPNGNALVGSYYDQYKAEFAQKYGVQWSAGSSTAQYPNDQRATTLWYHDHVMGITRVNVYSGLSGFYLLRGGASDLSSGLPTGKYEVPLLIQDRSFNADGSLFYPDNRAFFEGLKKSQLDIPLTPDGTIDNLGPSDISPIWNPEFFGNTMVVNGQTWPYLNVEQKQYRFRVLNGSDSRTMMLKMSNGMSFWVIGADGGFLPAPVKLDTLLMGPAERYDIIVDFTNVKTGTKLILQNIGGDSPFGGGQPGIDFPAANQATTGQVMQFRVIKSTCGDNSTTASNLRLPALKKLGMADNTPVVVSLNELESENVFVLVDADGAYLTDAAGNVMPVSQDIDLTNYPPGTAVAAFAPAEASLGTLNPDGTGNPLEFMDPVTEMPQLGHTEMWEIHNFTEDAHPIHLHLVEFEVIGRIDADGNVTGPEKWETGTKDTVMVYPGGVTKVKAKFDIAGLYLWHCHILSHEDNEMMRPYQVVP